MVRGEDQAVTVDVKRVAGGSFSWSDPAVRIHIDRVALQGAYHLPTREDDMIGFEMTAEGSNGFRRSSSAWTEGSLIALKVAMSIPKVNVPGMGGTNRGILSSIEASFGKIAKNLLHNVCADGMNFTLFLTGDIRLKFFFDYSKSGDQLEGEFLKAIAGTQEELGDQVLIHLCRTIQDFFLHNFDKNDDLILKIDIDL